MPSSGMWHRVAIVRKVSEECTASFIRVEGISELQTMLAVSNSVELSTAREATSCAATR
jgi:hypothetical protein